MSLSVPSGTHAVPRQAPGLPGPMTLLLTPLASYDFVTALPSLHLLASFNPGSPALPLQFYTELRPAPGPSALAPGSSLDEWPLTACWGV